MSSDMFSKTTENQNDSAVIENTITADDETKTGLFPKVNSKRSM
jgi:hypothetical protein